MSDVSPELNLIQRAMQKVSARAAQTLEAQSSTTNGADADGTRESPLSSGPGHAPRPDRAAVLKLNIAKLRKSRALIPGVRDTIIFKEFRDIKRRLLNLAQDPKTKALTNNIFMVTSAMPGEGKTFMTMNLAMALALDPGLDVIVVDGDIIRSSIDDYFEGPKDGGLLDLLSGQRQRIDEVLHHCAELPNIHVMFAGTRNDLAIELFAKQRTVEIFEALSKRFAQTIVLIDTPPVLATPEAATLAPDVDHVLVVVSCGQSTKHQVEAALEGVAKASSINLLLNKWPEWQRRATYSYYYYDRDPHAREP